MRKVPYNKDDDLNKSSKIYKKLTKLASRRDSIANILSMPSCNNFGYNRVLARNFVVNNLLIRTTQLYSNKASALRIAKKKLTEKAFML